MEKLDAIIHDLDKAALKPPEPIETKFRMPMPRLESTSSDPDKAAKYEALVELKNILDAQFNEYSENAQKDFLNPHNDQRLRSDGTVSGLQTISGGTSGLQTISGGTGGDITSGGSDLFNDADRLKLPLVGVPNASPETDLPIDNEDALNILVKQGSLNQGGVSIHPVEDNNELKENITQLIGIDFDELIDKVSESIGEVNMPLRVEEHHTQLTETEGEQPYYKYTETVADVIPTNNPKNPDVNVVSKRYEEGDLLGTKEKTSFRWVPNQTGNTPKISSNQQLTNQQEKLPIRGLTPTLDEIANTASLKNSGGDVKVNVTTKTNIVNVFTFNIFINNGTKKNSFTMVKEAPVRSSIQTTANIDSNDSLTGRPLNSISLYQYQASNKGSEKEEEIPQLASESGLSPSKIRNNTMVGKQQEMTPNFSLNQMAPNFSSNQQETNSDAAELEKWLKILLNHQAYGDGSNIVAEAVLKDSSLQQLPAEARLGQLPVENEGVSHTLGQSRPLYRKIEETPQTSTGDYKFETPAPIGLLGYKTNMNGDIIDSSGKTKTPNEAKKGFIETLASSPIPTIVAGVAAMSPAVLTLLGRKRRKKAMEDSIDVLEQHLSYLRSTRYSTTKYVWYSWC